MEPKKANGLVENVATRLFRAGLRYWSIPVAVVAAILGFAWSRLSSRPPAYEEIPDWKPYALPSRALDPVTRSVSVVVFTDYECRYCRMLDEQLDSLPASLRSEIQVFVRHFPLARQHPHARSAATAVECARAQQRTMEMHTWLFRNQERIGQLEWQKVAHHVGVPDSLAFAECLTSKAPSGLIAEDMAAGRQLHVRGTPTFLVNDQLVRGVPSPSALEALIRRKLSQ